MTTISAGSLMIPTSDAPASLPRDERRSARDIAKYLFKNYEDGLNLRRDHERLWVKVRAIMMGLHYFDDKSGVPMPIPKKDGEVRAVRHVMHPKFRMELGRLNANIIGVAVTPRMGLGATAFSGAAYGQSMMSHWFDEVCVQGFYDRANQWALMEGTVGYYRYADMFRKNVYLKPIPASELFPIPYDATDMEDCDGIQRVHFVGRGWLEMQDDQYQRKNGKPPDMKMAKAVGRFPTALGVGRPGLGVNLDQRGSMDGAIAVETWLKPTETDPGGQYFFMLHDELHRANVGLDEKGNSKALPDGKLPIELMHYTKRPDDFWADGFCEMLIAPQLEANRQQTARVKSALFNKTHIGFDSALIDAKDIQQTESGLFPFDGNKLFERRNVDPLISVPATTVSRDVDSTMQLVLDAADVVAGHESGILMGRAEGRVEGGPATNLLNANAQAPLQPVLDRIFYAFKRTYPAVLDMLRIVWPDNKKVRVVGPQGFAREITISQSQMPSSQDVEIEPTPVMANGRHAMANMAFQLYSMPSQEGRPPLINERELRRTLKALNLAPPHLDLLSKPEQRILTRIELIINDGVTPAYQPPGIDPQTGMPRGAELQYEDHRLAVQLLLEYMLDPSFEIYSPQVRKTLSEMLDFHRMRASGGAKPPEVFDNEVERMDRIQMEQGLDIAEQDLGSFTGQMTLDGLPLGV